MRLALIMLGFLLLSGSASAEPFSGIPDLKDLVERPKIGLYRLTCKEIQAESEAQGYRVIPAKDGLVRLERFLSVRLVLMFKPMLPTDRVAHALLVSACIEDRTDYKITSGRGAGREAKRNTDPENRSGLGVNFSKRRFLMQGTR